MRMQTATDDHRRKLARHLVQMQRPGLDRYDPDDRAEIYRRAERAEFTTHKGGTVYAYVSWGRWLADCVTEMCGGAELVAPGHRMVCGSCMAEHAVVWPDEPDAIEAELAPRPVSKQSWNPGESVADLKRQNIEHGVGGRR